MSVQCSQVLYFDLGEKRHVYAEVSAVCDEEVTFTISEATYELINSDDEIEDSGDCTINDILLDAFIAPESAGTYKLRFIYVVSDETFIDIVKVKVR